MEDTLRDDIKKLIKNYQFEVLILVLMEDTLRDQLKSFAYKARIAS